MTKEKSPKSLILIFAGVLAGFAISKSIQYFKASHQERKPSEIISTFASEFQPNSDVSPILKRAIQLAEPIESVVVNIELLQIGPDTRPPLPPPPDPPGGQVLQVEPSEPKPVNLILDPEKKYQNVVASASPFLTALIGTIASSSENSNWDKNTGKKEIDDFNQTLARYPSGLIVIDFLFPQKKETYSAEVLYENHRVKKIVAGPSR